MINWPAVPERFDAFAHHSPGGAYSHSSRPPGSTEPCRNSAQSDPETPRDLPTIR